MALSAVSLNLEYVKSYMLRGRNLIYYGHMCTEFGESVDTKNSAVYLTLEEDLWSSMTSNYQNLLLLRLLPDFSQTMEHCSWVL